MSDTVQQVKDRLSIIDVVAGYVKLERAGQNMRARCPFHAEKTPSFMVSPERGTYHCFGCNVGGDIFSFIEAIEGVDFKGALKILAEKAGVPLVYSGREKKDENDRLFEVMEHATIFYQSKLGEDAKSYLEGRGIQAETIRTFRIGYAGEGWSELSDHLKQKPVRSGRFSDKEILDAGLAKKGDRGSLTDKFRNRIMFPISDTAGRVVAFSGRTFGEKAHPDAPKYLNSPETALYHKSRILYGFDRAKQAIRKHNFAVLVEGQMDLCLSHQSGFPNAIAVSGTAFTVEHAALIKRMSENLVIALDPDEAGFKAASRAARAALQQGLNVKVAQLPPGLDPADLIMKEGVDAWRTTIRGAKDIITFLLDVLEENAKAKDAFRRTVESVVLPFLQDVRSPIAREQYEKEIANRLGVSEAAVRGAAAKTPVMPSPGAPSQTPVRAPETLNRIRQAYGLLLWQESLAKPSIEVGEFAAGLEDAIGKDAFEGLKNIPESEKEVLRFRAEELNSTNGALKRAAEALLAILKRERLERERAKATEALREAEREERHEEGRRLEQTIHTLNSAIAKLAQ